MSDAPEKAPPKVTWRDTYGWPLGVAGQLVAGAAGAYVYSIVRQHNYIAPFLVGICVGFGGRFLSNKGGVVMALLAVVMALCGSVVGEWMGAPFLDDRSLGYFLTQMSDLPRVTLILHAVGAAMAAWIAWEAPRRG